MLLPVPLLVRALEKVQVQVQVGQTRCRLRWALVTSLASPLSLRQQ